MKVTTGEWSVGRFSAQGLLEGGEVPELDGGAQDHEAFFFTRMIM